MTDFDLLDVLSGRDDAEDARRAVLKRYNEIRATCPDGRDIPKGWTWCGR